MGVSVGVSLVSVRVSQFYTSSSFILLTFEIYECCIVINAQLNLSECEF